jgi:acetylornithine deacetylase/succinyl-diaminopimelate desuccinylase-like protein
MRERLDQHPVELLHHLIRFDTTNPPGNEAQCVRYLASVLQEAGFTPTIVAKQPERPNLIAHLKGRGEAPPLLLHGHVDVVTAKDQRWTYPPFEGIIADGYLWGRGALDMKSGVVTILCALLRARAEGITPPGDIIAAFVSDEENGGTYGAEYLVTEHRQLFEGVRYSIGEGGGSTYYVEGRKLYPIMVAEKQTCWMHTTLRGAGGHASRRHRGTAMAKLGQLLTALDQHRLPVHITPVVRLMIQELADALPADSSHALRQLLDPARTDAVLDELGERGAEFDPLLHNTVNATIVQGGFKTNVIPSEIVVTLDGRLLPGFQAETLFAELRQLVGRELELEIESHTPSPSEPDLSLYPLLRDILHEADPDARPFPHVLTGATDGAFFAQLGIQNYGFLPLALPPDFDPMSLIHAADERLPLDAMDFGIAALLQLFQRFGIH